MRARAIQLVVCWLLLYSWQLDAQVSKPIVRNDQVDLKSSKYLQRMNEDDADNTERLVHIDILCILGHQSCRMQVACVRAMTIWLHAGMRRMRLHHKVNVERI